ncbi:SH3 domain-containing protein [Streptomyces luteosporeus]|uniref:SH3b domain-containing protein n=1 Tax=Streptomyces luteosporeus TaxID=173856 RepID=A0ABN3TX38_9ACTN
MPIPSVLRRTVPAVALAATAALAVGAAPSAFAQTPAASGGSGREACDAGSFDRIESVSTRSGVNLRTGPGTGYSSRGLVYNGTTIYVGCFSSEGFAYVQVRSGAHDGEYGWIATDYITGLFD